RKPSVSTPDPEPETLGICHPLLHKDDRIAADVPRNEQIGAGEDQIIRTVLPTLVDRKVVLLEIVQCPRRQLVAERRHLRQPEPLQDVRVPVVEVAGEETITLDQLLSDLVHLRGLVLRPADEQYPWPRHSQMFVRAAIVAPPCERRA